MLYMLIQSKIYKVFGLQDTGAVQSLLSENELRKNLTGCPDALVHKWPPTTFNIQTPMLNFS